MKGHLVLRDRHHLQKGNHLKHLKDFALKPRPQSGFDYLICAILDLYESKEEEGEEVFTTRDQIAVINRLDLNHKPPDSGVRQYKSRD